LKIGDDVAARDSIVERAGLGAATCALAGELGDNRQIRAVAHDSRHSGEDVEFEAKPGSGPSV